MKDSEELESLLQEISSRKRLPRKPEPSLMDKLKALLFPPNSTSFKDGPTPTRKAPVGPNRLSPMPKYKGSPEVPPVKIDKKKLIELIARANEDEGEEEES